MLLTVLLGKTNALVTLMGCYWISAARSDCRRESRKI